MKNMLAALITLALLPFAANAHEHGADHKNETHAKHEKEMDKDGNDHTHADHHPEKAAEK